MNLITKEMTSTFLGDDDQEVAEPNANLPSYKMSAEELFYAQMNGEAIIPPSNTGITNLSPQEKFETSADSLDFDDDCSFGGLALPDDDVRAEFVDKDGTHRRSSVGSGSKGSSQGKTSSKGSKTSVRSSGTKKTVRSDSSNSQSSSGDEALSMEEIQEYVMNNLPPEVRDKIPKEAWAQIFGKSMLARKARRKSSRDANDSKVEDEDDDSSIISDITEITTHPGLVIESSNDERDLKPEELDWDEEVCPGLEVSRRPSESDNKSKSSNSSGEASSSRYRIDSSGNVCCEQTGNTKVGFSYVQVRYYERILEINPAVTSGPAIGIGWRFKRGGYIDVDDWELQRGGPSRRNNELILPREVRERILKDAGYDQKQIAEAVRIIRKAKDRRKVTVQNLGGSTEAMEETVEAASRRIKGILSFGSKRGLLKSL